MTNHKLSQSQPEDDSVEENIKEATEMFKQGRKNPAVKDALLKEKQPVTPDDLSPLHNTREIGTSGGDQRARESDPNEID